MKPYIFVGLKGALASLGLLFQYISIELLGASLTGQFNRIQLLSLAISSIMYPGIEVVMLRILPKFRKNNEEKYIFFRMQITKILIAFLGFVFLGAAISFLLWHFETKLSERVLIVVIPLAMLIFCNRLMPVLFRIEGRYVASILSEPGVIFGILSLMILSFSQLSIGINAAAVWSVTILTATIFLVLVLLTGNSNIFSRKDGEFENSARQVLSSNYSWAFALIPLSNFFMLWGLGTVGALFLPNESIAKSVSIMRILGILLFVEGAIVAYFLPRISEFSHNHINTKTFLVFRRYMVGGTLITSLVLLLALIVFQPFHLEKTDYTLVCSLAVVQLYVAYKRSPFALATVFAPKRDIAKISFSIIFGALLSIGFLYIFGHWQIIIVSFIILQIIRVVLSEYSLRRAPAYSSMVAL